MAQAQRWLQKAAQDEGTIGEFAKLDLKFYFS